jgi:hypothetical protein
MLRRLALLSRLARASNLSLPRPGNKRLASRKHRDSRTTCTNAESEAQQLDFALAF